VYIAVCRVRGHGKLMLRASLEKCMGSCKYDLIRMHLTFSLVLLNFAAAVRAELRDGSACGEWRSLLSQRHPVYISGNEIYYSYSRLL